MEDNNSEIRFDLIPADAYKGIAKVFTKINDESSTLNLLNKLKHSLNEFERLSDIDDDGLYNIDKVAAYAMKIHSLLSNKPFLDNRFLSMNNVPRIALDVDEVVCDFLGGYKQATGDTLNPYWATSYDMPKRLKELSLNEEFWINLPIKFKPNFEPVCYISSRSIPVEYTEKFIKKNGLPCAPVYHVPFNTSKLDLLRQHKIDILIDDRVENFLEATKNGIFCYLMDSAGNQYFDAKNRRIYDLTLFK